MQIVNTKTLVTYSSRTTKARSGFASIVTRREGNTERVTSYELHPTRAKAYRYAVALCKGQARNHAWVN